MVDKTIIILVGIPCSGKSSWVAKLIAYEEPNTVAVVSRDAIRQSEYFPKPYTFTRTNEGLVTDLFNVDLNNKLREPFVQYIVLDNTHCKEKYIDEINIKYGKTYHIAIKFFDCSFQKAWIRNLVRRVVSMNPYKWIPYKIMIDMERNYKTINKEKYGNLLYQ